MDKLKEENKNAMNTNNNLNMTEEIKKYEKECEKELKNYQEQLDEKLEQKKKEINEIYERNRYFAKSIKCGKNTIGTNTIKFFEKVGRI